MIKKLRHESKIYWSSSRAFLLQESNGLVEQTSEADMFSMSSMLLSLSFVNFLWILSFRTDLILSWWVEELNRKVSSYWLTYHKIVQLIPVRHIFTGMLAHRMRNFNVMEINFLWKRWVCFYFQCTICIPVTLSLDVQPSKSSLTFQFLTSLAWWLYICSASLSSEQAKAEHVCDFGIRRTRSAISG